MTVCFFMMMDMQPASPRIWAFLIGIFWVSFVTYYVLWAAYKRVVELRNNLASSLVARPQQYTVLVRDIPKAEIHETRAEQIDAFFRRVHPGAYETNMVVGNYKAVSDDDTFKVYTFVHELFTCFVIF